MSSDWEDPADLPEHLQTPEQRETTAATPDGVHDADPDAGGEAQERLDIDGHEEFVQRQMLEDIIRARRDARQALAEAAIRRADEDTAGPSAINQALYGRVWSLISLLKGELQKTELGQEYWYRSDIGEWTLPQPESVEVPNRRNVEQNPAAQGVTVHGIPDRMIPAFSHTPVETPDRSTVPFESLTNTQQQAVFEAVKKAPQASVTDNKEQRGAPEQLKANVVGLSDFWEIESEVQITWRYSPKGLASTTTKSRILAPPEALSRTAFELIDEFLSKAGLTPDVTDGGQPELDLDEF